MSTKKSASLPTIVATLSQQLTLEYRRGFAEKNLRRMAQFAEVLPDGQIVATVSRQTVSRQLKPDLIEGLIQGNNAS